MSDRIDEDFDRESAGHVRALIRRASWLDRRLRNTDPRKGSAVFDQAELNALRWALLELGAAYDVDADGEDDGGEPPALYDEPPRRERRDYRRRAPGRYLPYGTN
jgi:hypothetical protein